MDDVDNVDRLTLVPKAFILPDVCSDCEDKDLAFKKKKKKNCKWVKNNLKRCKKTWKKKRIKNYWCRKTCGLCN